MRTTIRGSLEQFRLWACMLLFIALFLGVPAAFAETYSHTYRIDKPEVRTLPDGTAVVEIPHALQRATGVGAPLLPLVASRLYIPDGQSIDQVTVTLGTMQTLPGRYVLAHAVSPRPISDKSAARPESANQAIYASSTPYPPQTWKRASDQRLHGYRIALTDFYPVRYTPATGVVQYAETVTVTIFTTPSKTVSPGRLAPRTVSRDVQSVLDFIDNDQTLTGEGEKTSAAPTATDRQYLLITTAALQSAFEPLLTHRAASAGGGFTTFAATVEDIDSSQSGRDLAEKIRNYIIDSYTNYGTQFVVLGGDADGPQAGQAVATRGCPATVSSYSDSYIPTDYYYACLDGTWDNDTDSVFGESTDGVGGGDIDWLAEVAVGRIPADTAQEAQYAINKIIAYETTSSPFKTLLVGELLDTTPTWGGDKLDYVYEAMSAMPRDTLYDRDDAAKDWPAATLQSMLSSNSYSIVSHLGHSNVTYNMKMTNTGLDNITNTDFFLLYSQGCYSNSFDNRDSDENYGSTDSIGEDFVVRNASNAFAYIGNSRYGWYSYGSTANSASNLVHRRFIEAVFQSSIVRIGLANNSSKANLDYTDGLYRWIAFETNLMGDPATPLDIACNNDGIMVTIQTPAQPFAAEINVATQLLARISTECGDSLTGAVVSAAFSTGESAVTLYDDGTHQDGAANDGVYGGAWTPRNFAASATITVSASKTGYTAGTSSVSGKVPSPAQYSQSSGTYAWISDSGATTVLSSGDDVAVSVPLGFTFNFYGTTYDSVHVSSNGTLSFTDASSYYNNAAIPNSANPNALIAVFWDDLDIDSALSGSVSYKKIGTSPDSFGVITWKNVRRYGVSSDTATFQAVISERTGTIKLQYADVSFSDTRDDGGAGATVGIENQTGTEGLQYSYNQAALSAGRAVVFAPVTARNPGVPTILQLLLLN